ncbi:hypothetical protein FOS14_00930 [Skermania sp. ID1734]|uniref:baeRF2 domain-containing protein n=1 Tax=Skermania sp. ID1734 TaxID=2597516 RepID=UPI00117ED6E8|nr:hypothetical protein [Skermania sp. ID1734]TSE01986.1 hypothetical protein FOS14_00930 [Skermania sp. ID1734]
MASKWDVLTSAAGPFASVYVDDSHDTADARKRRELACRAARDSLANAGADEVLVGEVERELLDSAPPVGRRGRAVIATDSAILLNEELIQPPARDLARFGSLPYLVPLIDQGPLELTVLVAAVDHTGVRLEVVDELEHTLDTRDYEPGRHPVHKAHTGGLERYKDTQRHTEDIVRRNLHDCAHEIAAAADQRGVDCIVLAGEVQSSSATYDLLPEAAQRVTVRVEAGSRSTGFRNPELREQVRELFARRRLELMADAAERFMAASGRDELAAAGIAAVSNALEAANVDTLLLTEPANKTVTVAGRTGPADEVLPYHALATGARIVRIDERLTLTDGFGALLRHD